MSKTYLLGLLHDATERKYTYRISQKDYNFVGFIASLIRKTGFKAWIYKEGKNRNLYVVEFSKRALKGTRIDTKTRKIDYIRGYFDAEGSVPEKQETRFYIYFAQNSKKDLENVRKLLIELNIKCGIMHNPSKKKPTYWRFYVSSKSYKRFIRNVGSWHPRKSQLLRKMI